MSETMLTNRQIRDIAIEAEMLAGNAKIMGSCMKDRPDIVERLRIEITEQVKKIIAIAQEAQ